MAKNISRKDFLKGAAMSAAGVGLFASGLMNAAAEEEKPEYKNSSNWVLASQNVKWDEEHDIVIAGYGMAGTAAYIEAVEIDPNVDVVIYRQVRRRERGRPGDCIRPVRHLPAQKDDIETFRTYMRSHERAAAPCPKRTCSWLTDQFADRPAAWIQGALEPAGYEVGYSGGGALRYGTLLVEFPEAGRRGFRRRDGSLPQEGRRHSV